MKDIFTSHFPVNRIIYQCLRAMLGSTLIFIASIHIAYAADRISAQIIVDQEPVQISSIVSLTAQIGDVIPLTIQVNHPTGYRMTPVGADNLELWNEFEVRSLYPVEITKNPDGGEISSQPIEVILWETGIFITPIFPISVTDSDGNLTETIVLPAIVGIVSVLKEGDTALRDIKPQATLPTPPLWPWIVAISILLLFIFIGLIRLWPYLSNRTAKPQTIIDRRSPRQIALEQFDQIEAQKLPEQQRFKEYYTQVADVLRAYLEKAYHVPALGRTTQEIRRELHSVPEQADFQSRFFNLLDVADLVKFAQVTPTIENTQETLAEARQIVLDEPTAENIQNGHEIAI